MTKRRWLCGTCTEFWLRAVWHNKRVSPVITGLKYMHLEELSLEFYNFPSCPWMAATNLCARGNFAHAGLPLITVRLWLCLQIVLILNCSGLLRFQYIKKKKILKKTPLKRPGLYFQWHMCKLRFHLYSCWKLGSWENVLIRSHIILSTKFNTET